MAATLSPKENEALRHIRNSLVHRGHAPSVRELMRSLKYRSPRSAFIIINELLEKRMLRRKSDGGLALSRLVEENASQSKTVDVPLVGSISCGTPLFSQENLEAMIPVSVSLARPPHQYFLLRAKGDSMNKKGINEGDLVLVRQAPTAKNGDAVVALIDDEATIKEFHKAGEVIILRPRSDNPRHKDIILSRDFTVQGVVSATVPKV